MSQTKNTTQKYCERKKHLDIVFTVQIFFKKQNNLI